MTLSSYKVLIADDNPTFAKTLSMLVKSILGPKLNAIDLAKNGKEAVKMAFGEYKYNVVFMDINMPEMDGIEATKIINRELYRDTKIVAVSFQNDMNTVTKMLESGAETYIFKDKLTIDIIEKVFDI
jgi:CheY-like chemotaxis protein